MKSSWSPSSISLNQLCRNLQRLKLKTETNQSPNGFHSPGFFSGLLLASFKPRVVLDLVWGPEEGKVIPHFWVSSSHRGEVVQPTCHYCKVGHVPKLLATSGLTSSAKSISSSGPSEVVQFQTHNRFWSFFIKIKEPMLILLNSPRVPGWITRWTQTPKEGDHVNETKQPVTKLWKQLPSITTAADKNIKRFLGTKLGGNKGKEKTWVIDNNS